MVGIDAFYLFPYDILQQEKDRSSYYEEPFGWFSPCHIVSKLAANNKVKVVLNGTGPDELLYCYGRERRLKLWKMLRPWRAVLKLFPNFNNRFAIKLKEYSQLNDLYEYYACVISIWSEHQKRIYLFDIPQAWNSFTKFKALYAPKDFRFSSPMEVFSFMDMVHFVANFQLYLFDQHTMNFSLECRFPFLDHELVELACRIPTKLKISGGVRKYILRQVAKKLIPPACLTSPKRSFTFPIAVWRSGVLNLTMGKSINLLKKRDIINSSAVDRLKNVIGHRSMSSYWTDYFRLWSLSSLELWMENFIDAKR